MTSLLSQVCPEGISAVLYSLMLFCDNLLVRSVSWTSPSRENTSLPRLSALWNAAHHPGILKNSLKKKNDEKNEDALKCETLATYWTAIQQGMNACLGWTKFNSCDSHKILLDQNTVNCICRASTDKMKQPNWNKTNETSHIMFTSSSIYIYM